MASSYAFCESQLGICLTGDCALDSLGRARSEMTAFLQLLSTDFDGTLHSDYEWPAVPEVLQGRLKELQAIGAKWCINTGRDYISLMEGMARAELKVQPDFLVTVEREIYLREGNEFVPHSDWNNLCESEQEQVFGRVRPALPELIEWIRDRFDAEVYEDAFSPFCLIAKDNEDCDAIHAQADAFLSDWPDLDFVRNDIYARLSHTAFNKGSALGEVARLSGVNSSVTLAAGDHLNDLPMLDPRYAKWTVTQHNAVEKVKAHVKSHGGFVSQQPCGAGLLEGIDWAMNELKSARSLD
ncbi:MAG: hypothetical protein CMO74_09950 [Verrucomicrobiales bacterium]|nr:hypothetical protein [Verrucomicrobiales bacterium]